ncbi:hypothetical protein GOP47_0028462 [Adiantum capillus-veneris]|nr:hypothetical protein GOP47_0028462 [Adiantum capillus-veneris]
MGSGEDEALSDLEDDAPPVIVPSSASNLKSVLAELDAERQAKKAAEAAKAELVMRFKNYTQDASRQREEIAKQRDEALRAKEELAKQLNDAMKQRDEFFQQKDEALRAKDDLCRQRDEANRGRDSSRSEIEGAARLLVEGAEKITTRISSIKNLPASLPRSSSQTGVAAIAYGYTKRAEEIVEELVRQFESAHKGRSELREQMEQHNYQMAIEVSEMEATIQSLKDDIAQKTKDLEQFQKLASEKEGKAIEIEQELSSKLAQVTKQMDSLNSETQHARQRLDKLKEVALQLTLLLSKGNEAVANLADVASPVGLTSKKLFSPAAHADTEEILQDCVNRSKELNENCAKVGVTWREFQATKSQELNHLEGKITRLVTEKEEITTFLRSALANKHDILDISGREISVEGNGKASANEMKEGEVIGMASAIENEVKGLRRETFELQQSLATTRGEVEYLRAATERQMKELTQKTSMMQELGQNHRLAEEHIESLNLDIVTAQEEITHWKQAAMKEAEAGRAVVEEVERCQEEIAALKKQTEHLSQSLEESNSKLQSKEEMTMAAIAARNAAERSLRIADERAVELRERIEELNRQFDALERMGDGGISSSLYNLCWPNQWFRGRPLFFQGNTPTQPSAEMGELFEPLV